MLRVVKWFTVVLFVVFGLGVNAQVINNPGKPSSPKAGRIAKLTEVFRITDDGGKFYFKRPYRIKAAPDGSIFIADDGQFLKFDKNGKFIANIQKKGEGPGEFSYLLDFKVIGDRIFVVTQQPPKVLEFDLSGKLIKETRRNDGSGMSRVLDINKSNYYFVFGDIDLEKIKSGEAQSHQKLMVSTFDGKKKELNLDFPIRMLSEVVRTKNTMSVRIRTLDRFCVAFENENSIYVSHTEKYMIKHVDMVNGKILHTFSRKYEPVAYFPSEDEKKNDLKSSVKWFSDVQQIAIFKGNVWVITSTVDKKKGALVDVFSKDGKYIDNFYLPLSQVKRPDFFTDNPFYAWGDYFLVIDIDEDDNISIVKYKVEI